MTKTSKELLTTGNRLTSVQYILTFLPGGVTANLSVDLEGERLGCSYLHTVFEQPLAPAHGQQPV